MIRTGLVALLALAIAAPARPEQQPPATFESNITVVSLPVFVTDGKGHSVTGLRVEDFAVEDGGRPVRIAGFSEIDAGAAGEEGAAPLPPEARRQFLLLFDLSFTGVSGLMRARRAAADFVRTGLSPSDLVAVATFSSNHGVNLLTGFTSDRAQLARAVGQLGVMQRDRQADPLGMAYDLTEVGSAFSDALPEENGVFEAIRAVQLRFQRSQEVAYRQRVIGLLDSLGELGQALDSVKGRKQVIFLSNGFADSSLTGEQGEQALVDSEAVARGRVWEVPSDSRFGDAQIRQLMVDMLRGFSSSDAVVHAVDLSGLTARGDASGAGREPEFRSGRESLSEMASLSGGRLFKDTNDVGAVFRELSEVSRRYYLLAFEPEGAPRPGRFHKLKVKVRVKGSSVSHRSGYFERAAYASRPPLARRFEAADLIAKGGLRSELPLAALALPYVRGGGKVAVPVVLEALGSDLVAGDAATLGLELYGYAIGEDGGVRDFVAVASNLDLAKVGERLRASGLQAHATFTLAPGRYSLRFLLRDAATGRSGTHWMEVSVPDAVAGEVVLLPPLFMDDPQRFVVLQAPSSGTLAAVGSPFRVGAVAFAPRPRPVVANGREQSVCLLAQDGGRAYDAGGSFEILPTLVDTAGAPVPLGDFRLSQAVADDDGYRRFVLRFTPAGVPAGDYSLRVRIRDPQSGRVGESFQSLRVE